MAFDAKAVVIVRTGGSDANGGGFNPANANFLTDLAATSGTSSSPVVSSASYNFVAGDVSARVFIQSGTNWIPGWYTIASVASNQATLTASAGNATLYDGTQASGVSTATGCATTASPTGGVFGIDFSNQDAAEITYTDMVIDGTTNTKFTSAGNPVNKRLIGNYINVTSGTGFTVQRVEVVSTATTTATCDKSLGTLSSTGGNGKMGGALASPGMAGGVATVGGNDVFIASGTYTLTTSSLNVSGGPLRISASGSVSNPGVYEGFGVIPKDLGTAPVISAGAVTTISILDDFTGSSIIFVNLVVDGNSQASTTGISATGSGTIVYKCTAKNTTVIGVNIGIGSAIQCVATGCSGDALKSTTAGGSFINCESYSNTCPGFTATKQATFFNCLSYANSGASSDGFLTNTTAQQASFFECVAYNNGRHGFNTLGSTGALLQNCIAEGHAAGYGFTAANACFAVIVLNCGGYNNASGNIDTTKIVATPISFVTNTTGSFFTNPGSADFSLNNTANQGKLARGTGFPGAYPRGLTTGYADLGCAQHADPASGGSYTWVG